MYNQSALNEYTATRAATNSPVGLVVMLYQGVLRFIHEAEIAIEQRNFQEKANLINKSMRIVQELSNALEEEAAPDLTQRLRALYEYVEYELLQASTFNDKKHLHNAAQILNRLNESWTELSENGVSAPANREEAPAHPQQNRTEPADTVDVATAPPSAPTPWTENLESENGERVSSLSISA